LLCKDGKEKKKRILNFFVLKRDLQAIKKVLAQNFPIKEESESQILLYKNLWLEAEASLCVVNCMDRFNRLKIEIEKGSSQKVNGKPITYFLSSRSFMQSKGMCSLKSCAFSS
jgi:hypothetical protein